MASFSDTPDISDAAVAEGPEEVESMVDLPSVTLEIFNVVKSSHAQHGLRHGDYTRYRQYCSRRLRRIRKTLGMQHGKGRFVRRALEPHMVLQLSDPSLIPLPPPRPAPAKCPG